MHLLGPFSVSPSDPQLPSLAETQRQGLAHNTGGERKDPHIMTVRTHVKVLGIRLLEKE